MIDELDFLGAKFFYFDVPKEQKYLIKYFRTELQRIFMSYKLLGGEIKYFIDHTGYRCNKIFLYEQDIKFRKLVKLRESAKKSMDMVLLEKIETGKYKL